MAAFLRLHAPDIYAEVRRSAGRGQCGAGSSAAGSGTRAATASGLPACLPADPPASRARHAAGHRQLLSRCVCLV